MGKTETIKSDDKVAPLDRAARRAKRMESITKATNVTFTLELAVRRFIDAEAKAAGMNLTHFMQKLVEDHVINAAPEGDALALRLAAKRHVIGYAVTLASEMDAAGKFDEHFILNVVKEAAEDPEFATQYALAIGGEDAAGTRIAERARVSLNQQIGRLVKKAIGARSKRNEKGKIARAQVQGTLISTYTLLEKAA
ncbi:MAG: hypothetical protein WA790_16235 [Sulfitobacter sp.]